MQFNGWKLDHWEPKVLERPLICGFFHSLRVFRLTCHDPSLHNLAVLILHLLSEGLNHKYIDEKIERKLTKKGNPDYKVDKPESLSLGPWTSLSMHWDSRIVYD